MAKRFEELLLSAVPKLTTFYVDGGQVFVSLKWVNLYHLVYKKHCHNIKYLIFTEI